MGTWKKGSDVSVRRIDDAYITYATPNGSRLCKDYEYLPKWVQKDIALLKWMPECAWSSLGSWNMFEWDNLQASINEGKNVRVTSIEYLLYSPKRKKERGVS